MKLYYLFCAINVLYFALPVFGQSTNFCNDNSDCTVEGTNCQNGLCFCEVGKIFTTDGVKCVDIAPGIGFPCSDTTQCTSLIAGPSVCNQLDLCSCAEGHVFYDNKCAKYRGYNETCTQDTPCYDGADLFAMQCRDDTCVCSEGYYNRGDVGCRLAATENANNATECFLDIDCRDKSQYCKYKLNSWGPLGNCTDMPTMKCRKHEDCEGLLGNASYCSTERNNICFCKEGFDYNKTANTCEEELETKQQSSKKFVVPEVKLQPNMGNANIPCAKDSDCTAVKNSFCASFRKKCTCQNSFIFDKYSGQCVKALGSKCSDTEPKCGVKYAECNEDNYCQCPKYFIYSAYGDKCIKPTRVFEVHSCGSDENCYSFGPHSTCTKTNETDLITTCNCQSYSTFDEELQYCVASETGKCKDDCKDKLHSKCVNGVCKCEENYIEDKLQCLPNIGAKCSISEGDCDIIDFARCNPDSKICECDNGYFQAGPRECVEEIKSPEDECSSDTQCFNLLKEGGICVNKTCTCADTHVYDEQDIKCIRKRNFGEECSSRKDCSTMLYSENVLCIKGKCVCDYDYKFSDEKSQCVYNHAATNPIHGQLIFFIVVLVTTLIFFF